MHLEVIGEGAYEGLPAVNHVGKEAAVSLGKGISVSGHHQIIQLQRQIVDIVHPLAQSGKLGVEVFQILSHIIRLLDQLDHGIHHIHDTRSLIGGLHGLSEHSHHGVESGVLHLQNLLHIRHICGNMIVSVLIRLGSGNCGELSVELVQIVHTGADLIHCLRQLTQSSRHGDGILAFFQIEVVIALISAQISRLPVRPIGEPDLGGLRKGSLSIDGKAAGGIEAPVQVLLEANAYLVQARPVRIYFP